jgi:hypothetical protein
MIDNFERNHKLGILFECAVGNGKLLVCTSRLSEVMDEPEVKQYFSSITQYVQSKEFNPTHQLSIETLTRIFK